MLFKLFREIPYLKNYPLVSMMSW